MGTRTLVNNASQSAAEGFRCQHKVMALGLERRTQEIQMQRTELWTQCVEEEGGTERESVETYTLPHVK